MDSESTCPRCLTSKFRNPALKLLVNECGHPLCEACVDTIFFKGANNCPQCGVELRKNNFRPQLFSDPYVEKDVFIRKKLSKVYNKQEEDFPSLKEYNDYLEEFETLIYNLVYDIDVEATKQKIELYKKENKEAIIKNRGKTSKDDQYIKELLEMEKQSTEERIHQIVEEEREIKQCMTKKREALINNLIYSDMSLNEIVDSFTSETHAPVLPPKPSSKQASKQFSTGIKVGHGETFIPLPVKKKNLFVHKEHNQPTFGPPILEIDELIRRGFSQHVKITIDHAEVAGATPAYPCSLAIRHAYNCLYL